MIRIRDFVKHYPTQSIRINSLDIPYHGIMSIVGSSGAGKSSVARCLAGMDMNYDGSISYEKQKNIVMLPQHHSYFPRYTVYDNIALGQNHNPVLVQKTIDLLGLHKHAHCYPDTLSGGQKQRIGLGRVLMQNTDIIILDEPYSSLDYKSKLDNYAILLDLVQSQSKTIIIITHDLDEALYISDYVVTLFPHRQGLVDYLDLRGDARDHRGKYKSQLHQQFTNAS